MTQALNIDPTTLRYRGLIGTGGIGSGLFFALNGNHTLGREESRSGRILDRQDYCKLHIVAHYVRVLLGTPFEVLPIGKVGDDATGQRLRQEMGDVGIDLRHVHTEPGRNTLYSICLVYPDGSGGNLTTSDSACARVDPSFVRGAEEDMVVLSGWGIALAMPEVPLAARATLLELATRYRLLRAASFTSGEMSQAHNMGLLAHVDLLAVNRDEAAALSGLPADRPAEAIVEAAITLLSALWPAMRVSITAGRLGSWTWDGDSLRHLPAHAVPVANTAGAGDAHLAGLLVGLSAGLSLAEAHDLAGLVAALSVSSPHTINKAIDRIALHAFMQTLQTPPCTRVRALLEG